MRVTVVVLGFSTMMGFSSTEVVEPIEVPSKCSFRGSAARKVPGVEGVAGDVVARVSKDGFGEIPAEGLD